MGRYVARRLLQMIPVFFGVTLLVFLMMYALPGDPVRALLGEQSYDQAQIDAIKADLGLDLPLWQQYWNYISGLPSGDFGEQISTGTPVGEIIAQALPVTARLALLAFTFTVVLGVGLGLIAGLKVGRWPDTVILIVTLIFISVPVFVLGYIYQYVFSSTLEWTTPLVTDSENYGEMIMPAFVLASLSLAYVARLTRSSIAENRRADYMRTAVAKGLPQRRILSVHLLRNSLIPVVTFLGVDIGTLLAGAIVTEGIFNITGIGSELFGALNNREGSTVVGLVTLIVLIYLAVSLLVDLLYAVLDPRIRYA